MVKVKNANVGREENYKEGGSSKGERTGKGKGKGVATELRAPERFISIKEAANFEKWTRKWRKIAPGHRVDLSNMEGMEIIPKLFEHIGWGPYLHQRRFEEVFTRGEVLKRHDDRNVNKLDAYGRLLHHMISNIVIPNVGHKSSITNMHSFMYKKSLKGNLQRSRRSLKTSRFYENEVIKLKTLNTRRIVRDSL
ncbi:hypothetical protein M9H77_03304 [Catharanthus roseus]|uniref:Uncharacterized protein n=1 Tax=Catharanthus roseus TaxID=4058 RepID=A0ACC0CBD0_CATRO|nr:hypothetical protein M9H77_03304 [Catharanthus roseus]